MTSPTDNSFKKNIPNQDFKQKTKISLLFLLEIYRVIMASFLVLLVPQKCNNALCSLDDNMNSDWYFKKITFYFNIATFVIFILMYGIEMRREHHMINMLDVNKNKANDKDSVKSALELLPQSKKNIIWSYDSYYKNSAFICILFYIINLGLSINVLQYYYYGNKTVTVFITNFLFMSTKLSDVFSIVNTPKNIFYSSYLKNKVQFNDIDHDMLKNKDLVKLDEIEAVINNDV